MNDFELVTRFCRLQGRAYRPRAMVSRPLPPAEQAARRALLPHFSLNPLRALFGLAGLPAEFEDASSLESRALAEAILARAAAVPNEGLMALVARIAALHATLVVAHPTAAEPDLIAVPGSRTLARAVTARQIWQEFGMRPALAVSGGSPSYERDEPDAAVPEADAYAACLRLAGVPAASIIRERAATTTHENALFLGEAIALRREALGRPIHLLITSSGFHTARALFHVRLVHQGNPNIASIGCRPGPSLDPETILFEEGGRSAAQKVALLINEAIKIDFEMTRTTAP